MENTTRTPADTYAGDLKKAEDGLRSVQRRIYRTGTLRLLLFAATIAAIVAARSEGWGTVAAIAVTGTALFLLLVKLHNRLFARKEYLEKEAEVCRQELAALDYDFSAFDDGADLQDPQHDYAFDLDIFGPHSLFQSMNRTCTAPGRRQLAAWLSRHMEQKDDIVRRQEAVAELKHMHAFRQRFRITGLLHKGKAANDDELRAWAATDSVFRRNRLLRMLPAMVTAANAAGLALTVTGLVPGSLWGMTWAACLTLSFCFTGRISKMQVVYGKKLQILGVYARLLALADSQDMKSRELQALKKTISGEGNHAPEAIARLDQLMNGLDQRNNYLMYALLNGTFCWELWQTMRIEAWKEQYATRLPRWLDAIGKADALCAMGTFAYNHPDYPFPTLLDGDDVRQMTGDSHTASPFYLKAEGLGHPLMQAGRCVRNDMEMTLRPAFIIVTGANMAGKSTYLRTVGVNFLLACTGMPVCARRMELCPAQLVTSLRTTDSLTDNESYFFAELKRLKRIIDKLKAGEKLFIILDEILKGTNSTDKQKGSLALIRQFMRLDANGIIATHDLLLGTLAGHFPGHIKNFCFEAEIKDGRLDFSYRMRPGLAHNMNACFLMEKMGITMEE